MIVITNHTDKDVKASSGHVVKANGELSVNNSVWDKMVQEPFISGQVLRGRITVRHVKGTVETMAKDASNELDRLTKTEIRSLKKDEIIEYLNGKGVPAEKYEGLNKDDLVELANDV